MIVITGAAGFIGSCMITELNSSGIEDLILVDDFTSEKKADNYHHKKFAVGFNRDSFPDWLQGNTQGIDLIIHIGARTDTAEFNYEVFKELNLNYSRELWLICAQHRIPFIYASSAATYGNGETGYDDGTPPEMLHPLNPYGISKNEFDKYVLEQIKNGHAVPPYWYGLKFFNVYGPNEYHKGRMASVIYHAFNQFNATGRVKLFKSHQPDYKDGEQLRDFIYVKDVVHVINWLRINQPVSGIYNLGTGTARTFHDLAAATAAAMNIRLDIDWIDMPDDIRNKYQYFTEAKMDRLRNAGYKDPFYSLEEGINDYVKNYLLPRHYF